MKPRSLSIQKTLQNFCFGSLFSAVIYPVIGIALLVTMILIATFVRTVDLNWGYLFWGLMTVVLTIFVCNAGIGPLHRIMQHKAGVMKAPAQIITMINLMIAMQGTVREWVNYHSQHHRFADKPGDPHNPEEGKVWAWVGWIIWRDKNDTKRPMALWLRSHPIIVWMDRFYHHISIGLHAGVPAVIYLIVWLAGGSLVFTAFLHGCFMIGRAIQFHATVYGINVLGHLKTPKWLDYCVAILTGGEAFHDHHHDEPQSALHLPKKGFWNRLFDYNGTLLLIYQKLGWAKELKIAPRFITVEK